MERKATSRRRGEELEQAILDAAWEEFQDVGYLKLSMEGVAKRARTSKPVLYRRWSSLLELLIDCATSRMPTAESLSDNGTLREDTIDLLELLRVRMRTIGAPAALGMLSELSNEPELHRRFTSRLVTHVVTLMTMVIDRAIARGELRGDLITERLRQLPMDLARNEFLITADLSDEAIRSIVDEVFLPALQGIGALITK